MLSGSLRVALISSLLLCGPAALADSNPAKFESPGGSDDVARLKPSASPRAAQPLRPETANPRPTRSEQAARDLAFAYLELWSAPNQVTLASASSLYGPTVMFHGRMRTLGSVLAEKRRFAERWPDRTYRHRPETTQVACEASGERCTVWSSFDFTAGNSRQGRRSAGLGEHELVISLSGDRPVIASENSRVVLRGHGNMTSLLKEGLGARLP